MCAEECAMCRWCQTGAETGNDLSTPEADDQ